MRDSKTTDTESDADAPTEPEFESGAESGSSRVDDARRNVLRALGAGTALAATSGVASAGTGGRLFSADDDTADSEIDPQFGFPAASADVEPPVEPDHEIRVMIRPREDAPLPEFFFDPVGLRVEPGDTVKWNFVTGHHTVSAYHPGFGFRRRVPDCVPPYSSPVMPQGGYWLYTFERPGVYDYHCGPHELFGHVGRIVCGSAAGFEPLPDLCAGGSPGEGEDEGSSRELVVSNVGSDGTATYEFTVSGTVERLDDPRGDHAEGNRGHGTLYGWKDGYRITGDVTDFSADGALTVSIDGEEVDPDSLGDGGGGGESESESELRIPELTAYTVLTDDALDPERIVEKGAQPWSALAPESKQLFVSIEGFPPCGGE